MRRYCNFLAILALSLLFACAKKDGGKGNPGPAADVPPPNEPGQEDGGDPNAGSQDPGPAEVGTVAVDLSGATAVGVVEINANSSLKDIKGELITPGQVGIQTGQQLTAGTGNVFAKFTASGTVGFVFPPEIKNTSPELIDVVSSGDWGTVARFSTADQFLVKTNIGMIDAKDGGKLKPLKPEGLSVDFRCDRVEYDEADGLYGLCNGGLYRYDFAKSVFEKLTDDEQLVEKFLRLADGNVILQGRVATSNAAFLRRLKPNTGFEDFVDPRGTKVLESFGALGTRAVLSQRVMRVTDVPPNDRLVYHFLPERFEAAANEGTGTAINNAWLVTYTGKKRYAFNLSEDLIAGNPLLNSNQGDLAGATPGETRINIDSVKGLYYDGANVVQLTYAAGSLTSKVYRKLVYPNGPSLKIERIFGPDHGFTGTDWYAYGISPDGKLYWLQLTEASGAVNIAGKKLITLPTNAIASEVAQQTSVYKVGTRLVLFSNHYMIPAELSLLVESGSNMDITAKVAEAGFGPSHGWALVKNDVLYINGITNIHRYDPGTNENALVSPNLAILPTRLAGEGGSSDATCSAVRFFVGLARSADDGKPYLFGRLCDSAGTAAIGPFVLLKMSDFTFATVDTRTDIDFSLLDVPDTKYPELITAKEGATEGARKLLLVKSTGLTKAVKTDMSTNEAGTINIQQVKTNGFVAFGTNYPETGGAVEVALPWAGDSFLVSGNIGAGYKSYRVNLSEAPQLIDDDTTYNVAALDGVQVYGGGVDRNGILIVNGLRPSDGKRILVRLSPQFELIGTDTASNFKVLKVVASGQ